MEVEDSSRLRAIKQLDRRMFALRSSFRKVRCARLCALDASILAMTPSIYDRFWFRTAFFAALFVLLCLLRWPLADRPIRDVDESVSALIANSWLEGGVPYRDAIDQRGPVTYALYALTFLVAGKGNMMAVHVVLLLLISAGSWLAYRFARELDSGPLGHAWGFTAAALVAVCTFSYKRSQFLAFHTEWPTLLLSTAGMLLVWRAVRGGSTSARRGLLLSGALFGLSFLSKQPAVFDGAAAGGFLLLMAWSDVRLWRKQTWLDAGALVGGFLGIVLLAAGYFAVNGAWGDFYLYFWSYNVEHYTAVVPLSEKLSGLNPWDHSRHYLRANPLLFVAVAVETLRAAWRPIVAAPRTRRDDARLLLVLWLLGAYFGASFSGRNFGHYFIQIIAPCCLLAAGLVIEAGQALGSGLRGRAWSLAARAALASIVIAALGFTLRPFLVDAAVVEARRPPREAPTFERLLDAVRSLTTSEETIFVWGYHPEVYLLAPRRPATRYSNTNYLTGMLPWENHQWGVDTSEHIVPGAWDILMRELAASRPALIIDTAPGDHRSYGKYPLELFPRLNELLASSYIPVTSIPDDGGRPYYDLYLRKDRAAPTSHSARAAQ